MELKHNPTGKEDIDAERECREEMLGELRESMASAGFSEDDDEIVEWIVEHLEAITDSKEPYDEDEDAEEAECYKLPSYEYEDDEEDEDNWED